MNAERLFMHYEKIADAPDAIARLRSFILDLAVRGKLVPQDSNDEPASKLVKRIHSERAHLMKSGSNRKLPEPERFDSAEQPFGLPNNWEWVRLGDILTKLTDGTHHSPPNGNRGEFKYITAKNIKVAGISLENLTYVSRDVHAEIFARCNPEKGDILYIKDGATTGIVTINNLDEPFSMLSSVALLKLPKCLFNRLVVIFLRSPFFYNQMRGFMKGAAITRVTLKRMAPAIVPLPPLAEQHRIVAKVDELMALCDQLEAARTAKEMTRNRLAAASLARINKPDPETFADDARFALDVLPALTARPDQIKQLRQTILDLAVRGKLVPQDPNDQSALVWLENAISNQRAEHHTKRKTKVSPDMPTVVNAGYSLPVTWAWAPLRSLITLMDAGWSPQCADHPRSNSDTWGVLKTTAVQALAFDCRQHKELPNKLQPRPECETQVGDILVTRAGPKNRVGVACVVDNTEPRLMISDKLIRFRLLHGLSPRFFAITLNAGATNVAIEDAKSGMAVMQMNISQDKLRAVPVPLPPLAEQHRIVAKVDELLALCDQLEAILSTASDTRRQLLDALLDETLIPAELENKAAAE